MSIEQPNMRTEEEKEKGSFESYDVAAEKDLEQRKINRIEKLEKNSEKLEELLRLIDGYSFPGNPLPVRIGRGKVEKVEEKDGGNILKVKGEAGLRRSKWGKEFYEVNQAIDRENLRDFYNLEKLIGIAVHEVRHRVQNLPRELLNEANFQNLKNFKNLEKEYPILETLLKAFYESLPKKMKSEKQRVYRQREFDAEMVEHLARILWKKGIPLLEIANKIMLQNARKISV